MGVGLRRTILIVGLARSSGQSGSSLSSSSSSGSASGSGSSFDHGINTTYCRHMTIAEVTAIIGAAEPKWYDNRCFNVCPEHTTQERRQCMQSHTESRCTGVVSSNP